MGNKSVTSRDVDRMVELYRGGLTVQQVAADLGRGDLTVSEALRASGVQIRRPGPRDEISDKQILDLLIGGLTVQEVAAEVGMSTRGVYARLRRHEPTRQIYRRVPRPPGARTINRSKAVAARRRAAEERFPPTLRQRLLAELAAGALLRDAQKVVPVTSTTVWDRIRWDPVWAEQLVTVLDAHRPAGWSHGKPKTYDRGCRCTDCRNTKTYRDFPDADPSPTSGLVDDDTLLRLRAEGLTGQQIGERLGLPTATVHTRLRRHRVTGRPAHSPRTKLNVGQIIELYKSGLTLEQVGGQMGVVGTTVAKRLRAAGVDRRQGGPAPSPVTDQQLLGLKAQGLTGPQIAQRVGISKDGVYTRLRRIQLADRVDHQNAEQPDG